ncbi:MAG: HlyC/CorC family transporter [Anaerolineaceae bacterium]|nr:HlyC/CorC family transporter [Anaerolineaceae bacterium]
MEISVIVLLTLLNGVLAMSELAIVSARPARLQPYREKGDKRVQIVLDLMESPNQFLSTIQLGITLIGILAGAVGGATFAHTIAGWLNRIPLLAPTSEALGFAIVVLMTTYLSVVIGELVPKRLALHNPERAALLVAPWMRWLSRLGTPVVNLLSISTDAILALLRLRAASEPTVTEAEVKALIEEGIKVGVFEAHEQGMVTGVFDLDEQRIKSVMTPYTEIVWLNLDDPLADNLRIVATSDHALFPAAHGSLDHVIGFLRARDLLNAALTGAPINLKNHLHFPLFVSETKPASSVLELFKQTRQHIALVVGEFGEIAGLVTINDILEEIVGDMEVPQVVQRADGSWLLDGLLPIEEFKELFDLAELPGEDSYYTVGGFMAFFLGRIPTAADRFKWNDLYLEVIDMDGRRVDKVLATVAHTAPPEQ